MFRSKDWDDVKLSKLFCNLTNRGVVLQGGREEKRERGEGERRRWREEVRRKRGEREGGREGGRERGRERGREGKVLTLYREGRVNSFFYSY